MKADITMTVPLLDLKAQYAGLRNEIEAAIRDVCESQYFVMGPKVVDLERRIAGYSNVRHGIGVSSGTDALLVALMALDVGVNDAVVTTTYSFFATGGVISRLGAQPVFLDIEPDTYNLDPDCVRRFLENETDRKNGKVMHRKTGRAIRVLMPVHLYGQTANIRELKSIADEFGLYLVEDAAQAIGSESPGSHRAGSLGDIGCFSFFPSKNLGAFGDGGMCVCNDEVLAEKLRVLRLHGGKPKYYHAVIGGNFRLDALQAAVLLVKLQYLDSWTAGRQQNAARYDELFEGAENAIKTPKIQPDHRHIFNQYVIQVDRRDELLAHLKEKNIGSEVYYPVPLHRQECFSDLGYQAGDCPVAEHAAKHTLALPVYPELDDEQIKYVATTVRRFVDA